MAFPEGMKRKHGDHTGPRVRASEAAIRTAIKAAKAEGLIIDKLCVIAGQVEIHIRGSNEVEAPEEEDSGLEKW